MEQLTLNQALEQGYTHFGYSDDGYQPMNDLTDFDAEQATGKECLFSKEFRSPSVDAESLRELIADDTENNWDADIDDDTSDVLHIINSMPIHHFEALAKEINDELSRKHYYSLTDIKLIP